MESVNITYIGLGSNKGNKMEVLQRAVKTIYERVGLVKKISRVYKTEALGFTGDDFLNTVICVETTLSAQQLLSALLEIEVEMGRTRKKPKTYESRILDLDILLYNDAVINQNNLIVPHPKMHERRFVLEPLSTISKALIHPKFNKSVAQLLLNCKDHSVLEPQHVWLKLPHKKFNLSKHNYIAVEGNIGAGKTSLATSIAREFNAKLILERFADNPFLPKFYQNQERYAFTLEMSFLADRYQQISDDLSQLDLFKEFIISDYDVFKSLVFSKITLPSDEFLLYRKLFYQFYKEVPKPELYIYLYQSTDRLLENISERGRDYERHIDAEYLEKINAGYLDFLKSQSDLNVKTIDISHRDFVSNREDFIWVLNQISENN